MFNIYYILAKNFSYIVIQQVKMLLKLFWEKTRLLPNLHPENNLNNTMCR